MTFSDYLIDFTLIGLVLLQVKGRRLSTRALVLPLGIVAYVAYEYLHGVPTAHNDLFLIVGFAALGAIFGGLAGKFTAITKAADGAVIAKAGAAAAGLWILGTGGRLAFQLYANYGGGPSIMHFSHTHGITSAEAWTAALILMALSEVVMRTAVLAGRAYRVHGSWPLPAEAKKERPRLRATVLSGVRSMMDSSDSTVS